MPRNLNHVLRVRTCKRTKDCTAILWGEDSEKAHILLLPYVCANIYNLGDEALAVRTQSQKYTKLQSDLMFSETETTYAKLEYRIDMFFIINENTIITDESLHKRLCKQMVQNEQKYHLKKDY